MKMNFKLDHGYKVGSGEKEQVYFDVELRELTAGDLMDAAKDAEEVRQVIENDRIRYVTVRSEELFSLELLRRQIGKIGKIQGPFEMDDLRRFHAEDLLLVTQYANGLDAAALEDAAQRGRLDEAGGGA